jgi:hypothetical protein
MGDFLAPQSGLVLIENSPAVWTRKPPLALCDFQANNFACSEVVCWEVRFRVTTWKRAFFKKMPKQNATT